MSMCELKLGGTCPKFGVFPHFVLPPLQIVLYLCFQRNIEGVWEDLAGFASQARLCIVS